MTRVGLNISQLLAGCAAIWIAAVAPVHAQDESGGLEGRLTFAERLEHSDDETTLRSRLGLEISSITRTQSLEFALGGDIETNLSDGGNTDFDSPSVSLDYSLEGSSTVLTAALSYQSQGIERLTTDDDLDATTAFLDTGQKEDASASFALEFGRDAPFGGSLSYSLSQTNYQDITSTELFDQQRENIGLNLNFRFDPRIIGSLSFSNNTLDRDGGEDVLTRRASFGVDVDITKSLTANASIGWTEIETSGTTEFSKEQGSNFSFGLTAERPNGTLGATLQSDLSENGRRTNAVVTRDMDLRRGSLSFGLGISQDDDSDKTRPIYNLAYAHELPRGNFKIDARRQFSANSAGVETLNTRANFSLSLDLTSTSQLDTSFSWRETETLGTSDTNTRGTDFGISYAHKLSERWSLRSGYQHKNRTSSDGTTDKDDTVFIELSTAIDWRF